ncbi:MAG: DUF1972 domain-containing protein [Planctomycetota bacterium]
MSTSACRLRLAILGTRGIPANYGGFETFAEELSVRLAARGHDVTVYCRSHHTDRALRSYRGVRLVVQPTVRHKYFDTVVHTGLAVLHALTQRYDAVLVCNAINSPYCLLPRLVGQKVALNVDGLEWQRAKWNALGRLAYRLTARLATRTPQRLITDSLAVQSFYRETYGADSTFISYGSRTLDIPDPGTEVLRRLGLLPGEYLLYASRLEPENNAHLVVSAFEGVRTDKRLVILGHAPYAADYIAKVKATRDPRILFPGAIYGPEYLQLQLNSYLYIQATEVGGVHPALLEGLGAGKCILYLDVPEHREVLRAEDGQDVGVPFRTPGWQDLREQLQQLLDAPERVAELGRRAQALARRNYGWEGIADRYERLFLELVGSTQAAPLADKSTG